MKSEVLDFFTSQLSNGPSHMTGPFSVFEAPKALRHFDANKGSGLNGIPSSFYKKLIDAFARPHHNFQQITRRWNASSFVERGTRNTNLQIVSSIKARELNFVMS